MATTCPIPEGMELPADLEAGGTFEAVATVQLNEGNTISIMELDGNPLPEYKEKASDKEASFIDAVTAGMEE